MRLRVWCGVCTGWSAACVRAASASNARADRPATHALDAERAPCVHRPRLVQWVFRGVGVSWRPLKERPNLLIDAAIG
jgi:hypothetical protein